MIGDKKVLALIPARGGSKGLPGKNIRTLAGKPLIAWSIEQALNNQYIDDVVVSTDCPEIAKIAKQYGALVPFIRPEHLANDTAKSIDVIEHAVQTLRDQGKNYDILVLLEPTSPLREQKDISKALELLESNKIARSVVSVGIVESQHPGFCVSIHEQTGLIRPYEKQHSTSRRQDLSKIYYYDGTIYISYIDALLEKKSFYHENTLAYVVDKYKTYEIDDLCDFTIVDSLMNARLEGVEL